MIGYPMSKCDAVRLVSRYVLFLCTIILISAFFGYRHGLLWAAGVGIGYLMGSNEAARKRADRR